MSKAGGGDVPLCEVCGNNRTEYHIGKLQTCQAGPVSFTTAAGTVKTVQACGKCVWRDRHRTRA